MKTAPPARPRPGRRPRDVATSEIFRVEVVEVVVEVEVEVEVVTWDPR